MEMSSSEANEKTLENPYPEVQEAPRYSCSLAGAYAAVVGLYGAVPILHSGGGCGIGQLFGQFYAGGENAPGGQGGTSTPCTSLVEQHVIFGAEDRLRKVLKATTELMEGDLFVVINGCVPALIGDDIDAVVKEFKEKTNNKIAVVSVNTSGFAGNTYTGFEKFFDSVINQYLEPLPKQKYLINVLGVIPFQHVFWKGDLERIKELFAKIGVDANVIFGEFDGPAKLKQIPAAELNIVLNPWVGSDTAEKLKEKFGTPYLTFPSVPIGPKQTTELLIKVAKKLKIPSAKVRSVIEQEERKAYRNAEYFGDALLIGLPHAYTAVVGDSATAIGFTKYIANEVGYLPELVIITDNPPEEKRPEILKELSENIECAVKPDVFFESDTHKIRQLLKNNRSYLVLLASSLEKHFTPEFNNALHLSISFPILDRAIVERSYVGYRGGTTLMEDIIGKYVGPL
jgi:nitrogenase molybdenum-iron protein beta chain